MCSKLVEKVKRKHYTLSSKQDKRGEKRKEKVDQIQDAKKYDDRNESKYIHNNNKHKWTKLTG